MPIKQITPQSEINAYLEDAMTKKENDIIKVLKRVGELCINEARSNPGYMDQTGNLKSSIGYVVVRNGVVVGKAGFSLVKNGKDGQSEGKKYLEEKINEYSQGIVLIIVAGMNYAFYVENTGRNVLSSAELLAKKKVPDLLQQLGFVMQ